MGVNGRANPTISTEFSEARDVWESKLDNRYRLAKRDRFSTFADEHSQGVSEDQHVANEQDYFLMVERARSLDREDVVAGAIVNRFVNNVVQNGFMAVPKTGDAETDRYLSMRWKDWCDDPKECDESQEHTFHELTTIALRDAIVAGDVLLPMLSTGRLQIIEGHRLRTPTGLPNSEMTLFGVELDGARRHVAYWISEDDITINRSPLLSRSRRVPTFDERGNRQIIHLYHPKRATQTRGITKFAAVGKTAAMHDDVQFAKLVQQQSVSVWTLMRKRGMAFEMPEDVIEADRYDEDPCSPGQTRPIRNLSAGMIYTTYPGEDVSGFSPNVPNPTFFDHAKQLMQLVAINCDVPLVLVLLDASETNYSGWRGALEQAKVAFRGFQMWLRSKIHTPTYRWKVRSWVDPASPFSDAFLLAKLASGVNVFGVDWVLPTWQTTEPLKDSTDRLMRYANNMASLRRIHGEMNQDFDREVVDIVEDRAKLIGLAIERAIQLNSSYPDNPYPVTWMQLAANALPEGFNVNLQTDLTPPDDSSASESIDVERETP